MKSFKKISIAMVAAVSMSTLVATSANAATTALTVGGTSVSTGLVSTNPVLLPVPADNKVESADALKIAITGLDTGTTVSASATNSSIVTALHTDAAPVTSSAGSSTVSISTGTGTTAEFYVFTKTVNAGTVVVTLGGNTTTYHVKGTAGAAYNLTLTAPDTVAISTVNKVYAKTTDIFGNPVVTTTPSVTAINATVGTVAVSDTATGTFAFDVTSLATTGTVGLSAAITATDVVGLPAAAKSASKFIAVTNPADVLASVRAELASAQAALAAEKAAHAATKLAAETATVTAKTASDKQIADLKKAFNALIKKWNAKNPKAKVTLVK